MKKQMASIIHYIIAVSLLTIIGNTAYSQDYSNLKNNTINKIIRLPQLNIGDTLPNIMLKNVINNGDNAIHTLDFKDRLIILDFWSIGCKGCILALPHMDSLQKKYGKEVLILPVTKETKKTVLSFWVENKYTKNLNLPSVVNDTIFEQLFKHKYIPHEIWIYKNTIIGITNSQYVDSYNIDKVLSGTKVDWPIKNDFATFDLKGPLFALDENQVDSNAVRTYAAVGGYRNGINSSGFSGGSGIIRDSKNHSIRAFFLNQPLYDTYGSITLNLERKVPLIKPSIFLQPNQVIWEVKDKKDYKYISKEKSGYEQDWIRKHAICFESISVDSGQSDSDVYSQMIKDLNRLLGLNVRWENRLERVYVIEKDKKFEGKTFSGGMKVGDLIYDLNNVESNPYFFCSIELQNIDIPSEIANSKEISALSSKLLLYGLKLRWYNKIVDKLIFTEIGTPVHINTVVP